jgi:ribonucleoside-diphosphate reductase alpha chain
MEALVPQAVSTLAHVAVEGPGAVAHVGAGRRPALTANALVVLERRYLLRDAAGRPVEKPAELFRRVAHAVAQPDERYGADPRAAE